MRDRYITQLLHHSFFRISRDQAHHITSAPNDNSYWMGTKYGSFPPVMQAFLLSM